MTSNDDSLHVDLFYVNPGSGTQRFISREPMDSAILVRDGQPTQVAQGWATYYWVSRPHTMAECREVSSRSDRSEEDMDQLRDERDHYRDEFMALRGWLMRTVGSASSIRSAKRVVERLIKDAIERNRHV